MDEQTSTPYNSYTALNRAMLLKPAKDDGLLASILKESTVEFQGPNIALIKYYDEETKSEFVMTLMSSKLKETTSEEAMRRMVGPQLWSRVKMNRISNNGKIR